MKYIDLDQIDKSKYYREAEQYLREENLDCFKIDKDRFAFLYNDGLVKLYFVPFYKKTVTREQLQRAKKNPLIVITNDRDTKRKKGEPEMTRENGYLLLMAHVEDMCY